MAIKLHIVDGMGNTSVIGFPDGFTTKVEVGLTQVVRNVQGEQIISILAGLVLKIEHGPFQREPLEWTRVNNDVNGNPRYVVHFLALNTQAEKNGLVGAANTKYELALKRAKRIGGKKFHNKQYGGGILFQSYNLQETENSILRVLAEDEPNK
jgi:hypothetical protein